MPGFVKTEKYILRRQINVGIQQIHHNGQGAGSKIKDPNGGTEEIHKPAAPLFIQHRPQAQHGGAEKAGKHQVRLPGHPVVAVQETGRHEPQGIKKDKIDLETTAGPVMVIEQRHKSNDDDAAEEAVHFGPVFRRGRAEHKKTENEKPRPGVKNRPAP